MNVWTYVAFWLFLMGWKWRFMAEWIGKTERNISFRVALGIARSQYVYHRGVPAWAASGSLGRNVAMLTAYNILGTLAPILSQPHPCHMLSRVALCLSCIMFNQSWTQLLFIERFRTAKFKFRYLDPITWITTRNVRKRHASRIKPSYRISRTNNW